MISSTKGPSRKPNKTIPAVLAALGMTLIVGVIIVAVSFNSLFNQNVTPVQASPNSTPAATSTDTSTADQQTIQQLQSLVQQYQTREQQYQTELQQAATQLNQANSEVQQYQMLVNALQQAGVIQINANGQVSIGQRGFRGDDGN